MIGVQKVVKYVAIAFAFALIFGILSSIMYGINTIFNIIDISSDNTDKMVSIEISDFVSGLDVNVNKVDFKIKSYDGYNLKIEVTDKDRISYEVVGKRLIIKEKGLSIFNDECDLIIYVPEGKIFDNFLMTTDVGTVNIDDVSTEKLDFELGIGSVIIDNLNVYYNANIDSGVGKFVINNGYIKNLELDMGVGDVFISSELLDKNEINSGVGKLELGLVGSVNDYRIELDKGIGSSRLEDKSISSGIYGNGNNYLEIDGGIGEINISYLD